MKTSVMGLVSFSMVALVGLAGCMADGTGKDDPMPEATSPREDGPVAETSAALTGATDCGSSIRSHINWVQGGEITVQPTECMNNLMYGFGNGVLYSVMLTDKCIPG